MFFPERITSIKDSDRVLEIGPGSQPHPRANVYLDRYFETPELTLAQSGYAAPRKTTQPYVYYGGGALPFKDSSFDYVICSHVIEHVPVGELETFLSELTRVAGRGYIEVPTIFYELINFQDVHVWIINAENDRLLFLDKRTFINHRIYDIYRLMFYSKSSDLTKIFERYRDFFFVGFEWAGDVHWSFVDSVDRLVGEDELQRWKTYFDNVPAEPPREQSMPEQLIGILRRIRRKAEAGYTRATNLMAGLDVFHNKAIRFTSLRKSQIKKAGDRTPR